MNENKEKIRLLVNGEEAFPRLLECIRQAKATITINMFIWRDDKIGNQMADDVLAAADRGVKVTIIKDKQGEVFEKAEETKQSLFHKQYHFWGAFKAKGFDLMYPMKGKTKSSRQTPNAYISRLLTHPNIFLYKEEILNDHSKYFVFDDEILILGGMNIEDKEIYTDVEGKKYADYMIELDGEEYVKELKAQLMEGKSLTEPPVIDYIYNVKRKREKIFNAKPAIMKLLSEATSSIDIVMAYLGDKDITNKIIAKANGGVKVRLITSRRANLQNDFNMKTIKKIMRKTGNRVEVYLCKRMVHAKLLRIDHLMMTVGSVNLNKAAMKRMFELNVLIKAMPERFANSVSTSMNALINESQRIDRAELIEYRKWKAFLEQIA